MAAKKDIGRKKESSAKKDKEATAAAIAQAVEEQVKREDDFPPTIVLDSINKMSSTTKAAAVLIALGTDSASEVIKHLHENEIETLSAEMAKLQQLSADERDAITNEFYKMCVTQKAITEGGISYAQNLLQKAFGDKKASELVFKATNKIDSSAFAYVKDADTRNVLMVLQNEHPQTIALVLSHAPADKASQIIGEFPKQLQIEVVERISRLERANPELVGIVDRILKKRMSSMSSVSTIDHGGVSYIAEIMNRIDKSQQKAVFDGLYEENPTLVDEIKKRMFVFNDIVNLNDMEIQAFIREADTKDLTISLKAASEAVQERIFNNMSSRQKEMIQSDMQYLHNLRMRDVEAAQQRIIDVIRGLEESGDIVLFKGGDDEIIA